MPDKAKRKPRLTIRQLLARDDRTAVLQDAQRLLPDSTALMVVLHMRNGSVLTISEHGLETVAAVGMPTMAITGLTSDDSEDDSGRE